MLEILACAVTHAHWVGRMFESFMDQDRLVTIKDPFDREIEIVHIAVEHMLRDLDALTGRKCRVIL